MHRAALAFLLLVSTPVAADLLPAFPGAGGWGATTRGARACPGPARILVVDTLEDQSDGGCDSDSRNANCSLRDALTARGPRYVVDNAPPGVFALESRRIQVVEPCLTLNFSRAPSPHPVANGQIELVSGFHEGIFRYLHVAPGHAGIDEALGVTSGCNRVERRCAERKGRGRHLVPTERVCGDAPGAVRCGDAPCMLFEQGEIWKHLRQPPRCPTCDAWKRDRPHDFSGCNDRIAIGGDSIDTFHLSAGVHHVVIDHATLVWACDEAIGHMLNGRNFPGGVPRFGDVSVTHSIIGNGLRSDGETRICHRERNHNLGPLFNGDRATPSDRVRGYTLARNYLVNNGRRVPRITGGSAIEFVNNVAYNAESVFTEIRGRAPEMRIDVVGNLYRHGPAWSRQPAVFNLVAIDPFTPRVHVADNRFLDAAGRDLTAGTRRNDQWQHFRIHPASLRQAVILAVRGRGALGADTPSAGPTIPFAPLDAAQLPTRLLPDVGASLPCRTSLDRSLVRAYQQGTGHVPATHHPRVTGTPWPDLDADGVDDRWEAEHGVDLPLADPDADGYPNVEEWLNGTDPRSGDNRDTRAVTACVEGVPATP